MPGATALLTIQVMPWPAVDQKPRALPERRLKRIEPLRVVCHDLLKRVEPSVNTLVNYDRLLGHVRRTVHDYVALTLANTKYTRLVPDPVVRRVLALPKRSVMETFGEIEPCPV